MKSLINGQIVDHPDPTPEQKAAQVAYAQAHPAHPKTSVDGLTFLSRFALAEYSAITVAAANDPQLALWIDMLRIKGAITLAEEAAQSAKAYLVAKGLLTQDRANIIFA